MEMADIALASVQGMLPPSGFGVRSASPVQKDLALADGVASLMTLAELNGIKVASLSSAQPGAAGGTGKPISGLFAVVPMSGDRLYRADLVVKAEYKDYDGFRQFFSDLARAGVATQAVAVKKTSFEATLRFYGV